MALGQRHPKPGTSVLEQEQKIEPAWMQGMVAFLRGLPSDINPYPKTVKTGTKRTDWFIGWYDTRRILLFGENPGEEELVTLINKYRDN